MPDVVKYDFGIANGSPLLHEMPLGALWPADIGNEPFMMPVACKPPNYIIARYKKKWKYRYDMYVQCGRSALPVHCTSD